MPALRSTRGPGPKLALLTPGGDVERSFVLSGGEGIVGRSDGDITPPGDVYLSPVHAQFSVRDGQLWIRDPNGRHRGHGPIARRWVGARYLPFIFWLLDHRRT